MKIDQSLFSAGQHALNDAYGNCPKCDCELRLKHANKNTFLSCSQYPSCDFSQSLTSTEVTVVKVMDNSSCPECNQYLAVKKGRYGMFIGCTSFPDCTYIASKSKEQNEAIGECPKCSDGQLVKRQNKFGKSFVACNRFPQCKYIENAK